MFEHGARGRRGLILLVVGVVVLWPRPLPRAKPERRALLEIPAPAEPPRELETRLADMLSGRAAPGEVAGPRPDWDAAEASLANRIARAPAATRRALRERLIDSREPSGLRCLTARLLSRLKDPVALSFLEQVVEEAPGGTLTWEAAVLIADHPERGPAPRLERLAARLTGWGRQYAFVALRRLRDPRARAVGRAALHDPEPAVVRHAAAYLIEQGDAADIQQVDALARTHADLETRAVLRHWLTAGPPRP